MIIEIAILDIKPNYSMQFIEAFANAEKIIQRAKGYLGHSLHKSLSKEDRFMLQVKWQTIEEHKEGFRKSDNYKKWKELLHHFYDPFPEVEYYES